MSSAALCDLSLRVPLPASNAHRLRLASKLSIVFAQNGVTIRAKFFSLSVADVRYAGCATTAGNQIIHLFGRL